MTREPAVWPPIPSITRHSAAGEACTTVCRSSRYRDPPAHDGSVGSGSLGAPGVAADDQRVETAPSRVYRRARAMAWSRVSSPPGGSGMYWVMSCSEQTTSFRWRYSWLILLDGIGEALSRRLGIYAQRGQELGRGVGAGQVKQGAEHDPRASLAVPAGVTDARDDGLGRRGQPAGRPGAPRPARR